MASAVAARGLVLGAALLVVFPTVVGAQAELQMWLNPEMGKQIPRSDYRFTYYPDRRVDNQETHLGLSEHRVPQGERNAWIFTLIYASDEIIFNQPLPMPGIAYVWVPSDRFSAVIGVPFSSIEFKPFETLTLEAQYFPIRTVRARATWQIFQPLRAYAGFDWYHDKYYRADRDDKDDKIFYYEKRLTAGVRFDLRHVGFESYGGWAFDRFYYEGERYGDRHDNRIDVSDGPWIALAGPRSTIFLRRRSCYCGVP